MHGTTPLFWTLEDAVVTPGPLTYPTNALRFLSATDTQHASNSTEASLNIQQPADQVNNYPAAYSDVGWHQRQPPALLPLEIAIIGAGLGGLAAAIALQLAGHKVRVYEQAPVFGEVGAGIQVPPNSTRHLLAWGVGKHIEPHIAEPHGINIRRWADGSLIGVTRLRPDFKSKYHAPYWVLHRADYHSALLARALELGVRVNGDCEVVSYSFDDPASSPSTGHNEANRGGGSVLVTFKNGDTIGAHLVIAADGIKSVARTSVLRSHGKEPAEPRLSGQSAYRCTVPLPVIASNSETRWISDAPNQNLWVGPDRHSMTYPIGGINSPNRLFNLVLSHPESRPPDLWTRDPEKTKMEMRQNFEGFEPRFTEVIRILSEHPKAKVVKWPIVMGSPLDHWVHKTGKLVILGDAAHAMQPYMSQGAAMAVEDAAAMAELLSLVDSIDAIPLALDVFEKARKERTTGMQQASWLNGEIWHVADGEQQRIRDKAMSEKWVEEHGWSTNQWSDPTCQEWTYGYDAVGEVRAAWETSIRDLSVAE